jgi:hypothetical protein
MKGDETHCLGTSQRRSGRIEDRRKRRGGAQVFSTPPHAAGFWVFRGTRSEWRVLLRATGCEVRGLGDLELRNQSHRAGPARCARQLRASEAPTPALANAARSPRAVRSPRAARGARCCAGSGERRAASDERRRGRGVWCGRGLGCLEALRSRSSAQWLNRNPLQAARRP